MHASVFLVDYGMNGAIHWMDGMVVSRETIIVVVLHQVEVARGFIDINTFQPNEKESTCCTFNTHLLFGARLYYTSLFAFTNILKLTNKSESLGQHTHVSYHVEGIWARIHMPANMEPRDQKRSESP